MSVAGDVSAAPPQTASGEAEDAWPPAPTAWYAVAVLLLAYTFAYVDRAVLTILVEPIQHDLHINDTQVGLLHGFAFVIFYVTLGVPLGWIADRAHRVRLIAGSVAVWSVMTAACGLASSFAGLFAARIGVGVGEAGLSPAGYSLLSDAFPPQRRSRALGAYTLGIYFGSGLAILGGGLVVALTGSRPTVELPVVGAVRSWQAVFFALGLPGLLVALLALTVREPARQLHLGESPDPQAFRAELARTGRHLAAHLGVYAPLALGFSFLGVPFNVALLWARPYLSRHFGVSPATGAWIVGGVMLVCATAGILTGSALSDRAQARGRDEATIRTGLWASLGVIAPVALLPLAPTLPTAAVALGALLFFGAFAYGAAPAALAMITPNRMRATVSALYLLVVNIVGLTIGPVATGMLTDYVFRSKAAVGVSSSIVEGGSAVAATLFFLLALRPFREWVEAARTAAS